MRELTYTSPALVEVRFPVYDMSDVEEMARASRPSQTLGRFHAAYGSASLDALDAPQGVADAVREYASMAAEGIRDGAGLLLCGPNGVGKTWAAAAIANAAIEAGRTVEFTSMRDLIASMPYGAELGRLTSLARRSLVVIDDLGSERTTDTGRETAFSVIDALYTSMTPMVITTNMTPRYMAEASGGEARMLDRIRERCRMVEYIGPNKRKEAGRWTG